MKLDLSRAPMLLFRNIGARSGNIADVQRNMAVTKHGENWNNKVHLEECLR